MLGQQCRTCECWLCARTIQRWTSGAYRASEASTPYGTRTSCGTIFSSRNVGPPCRCALMSAHALSYESTSLQQFTPCTPSPTNVQAGIQILSWLWLVSTEAQVMEPPKCSAAMRHHIPRLGPISPRCCRRPYHRFNTLSRGVGCRLWCFGQGGHSDIDDRVANAQGCGGMDHGLHWGDADQGGCDVEPLHRSACSQLCCSAAAHAAVHSRLQLGRRTSRAAFLPAGLAICRGQPPGSAVLQQTGPQSHSMHAQGWAWADERKWDAALTWGATVVS